MKLTFIIFLSFITLCYSLNFYKPLNEENLILEYLQEPAKQNQQYEVSENLEGSSLLTYNSNGDFAVAHNDLNDQLLVLAFYTFNGDLISQYGIEETLIDGFVEYGHKGVSLTLSGQDDSVFLTFTAKKDGISTNSSIYGGIINTQGEWQRGGIQMIFKDTQIDSSVQPGSQILLQNPQSIKSGNYVYFLAIGTLNGGSNQVTYFNKINISGTNDLTVDNNMGTILEYTNTNNYFTITYTSQSCIDMNDNGLAICTYTQLTQVESQDVIINKLIKIEAGEVISLHDITQTSEKAQQVFTENQNNNLQRIPGTQKFVLSMLDNYTEVYMLLRLYDVSNLNNPVTEQVNTFYETLDLQSEEYQYNLQMVVLSTELGYLIYAFENYDGNTMNMIVEFNPTTCKTLGQPLQFSDLFQFYIYSRLIIIENQGKQKLCFFNNQNMGGAQVSQLNLRNINYCEDIDQEKWVCQLCQEGYTLDYYYNCIEGGNGKREIYVEKAKQYESVPYIDQEIQYLYENSQNSSLIIFISYFITILLI